MNFIRRFLLIRGLIIYITAIFILIAFLMTACSPAPSQQTPSPTITEEVILNQYHTSTPTRTLSPSNNKPTKTPLPPPTVTPFTHTIKKDETLLGIAIKYGVKVEDLLAANPGVNVHFLTIGTVLVIPLNGDLATPTPTIAPPPLQVSEPVCYPPQDKNLICLAEIVDSLKEAYEKITLRADLYAQDGTLVSQQFVTPLFDRLLQGNTLPIMVSFSEPTTGPENYSVQLTLLSALAITPVEDQTPSISRYLDTEVQGLQVKISENATSAQVTGKVAVFEGTSSLWLISVAYDHDQKPVGIRKLEVTDICPGQASETPEPIDTTTKSSVCVQIPFNLPVYSLGPKIERVEVFAEAHR